MGRLFVRALASICLLSAMPAASYAATVQAFTDSTSFYAAAAGIPLGTQDFDSIAAGTCIDSFYCSSEGVGGVTFDSPNAICEGCRYVPLSVSSKGSGLGGVNHVVAGGFSYYERGQSDTNMRLHFQPPVLAFAFELLQLAEFGGVNVTIVFADGSLDAGPYFVGGVEGSAFFGAVTDTPVSTVVIDPAFTKLIGGSAGLQDVDGAAAGAYHDPTFNDVVVGAATFGNADDGDYVLDNLTRSVPPPRCERSLDFDSTTTIEGQATAGAGAGGIDSVELVTDSPEHLTLATEFDSGDSHATFSVYFDGAVEDAAGTVVEIGRASCRERVLRLV